MNKLLIVLLCFVSNTFVYRVSHASSSYSRLVSISHDYHFIHAPIGEQPLAKIAIQKAVIAIHESASVRVNPFLLGFQVKMFSLISFFKYMLEFINFEFM